MSAIENCGALFAVWGCPPQNEALQVYLFIPGVSTLRQVKSVPGHLRGNPIRGIILVQCSAPLADLICRVYRSHRRVCYITIEGAIRKAAKASPEHKDTLLALLGPLESTGTSSTTVMAGLGNGGAEGDGGADEEQSAGADMGESHGDDGEWEDAY